MSLTEQDTQTKRCNRCHLLLRKSDFNPNPHFSDGLHGHCRMCQEITRQECEAIVADRDRKLEQKALQRSPEESEHLKQRNLQYRRRYLAKKKALREQTSKRGKSTESGP